MFAMTVTVDIDYAKISNSFIESLWKWLNYFIIWWKVFLKQVVYLNKIEINNWIPVTFEATTSFSKDDSSFFKQQQQWKVNRQSEGYYAIEKTVHCYSHPLMWSLASLQQHTTIVTSNTYLSNFMWRSVIKIERQS